MKKKLLSVVLAIAMLFTMIPENTLTAFAAGMVTDEDVILSAESTTDAIDGIRNAVPDGEGNDDVSNDVSEGDDERDVSDGDVSGGDGGRDVSDGDVSGGDGGRDVSDGDVSGGDGDGGETLAEVTRLEWLSALVEVFGMTVEEDNYPDNYFFDLSSDSEYYKTMMIATEFGLLDVEAGGCIQPENAATREFAAHTLNLCLGFQMDNGEEYTFAESNEVTYPNDIQVSIDKEWLALQNEGNEFLPDMGITLVEKTDMLEYAQNIIASRQIDTDHENTWELADGVIDLTETIEAQMTDVDEYTLSNCAEDITVGNIYAFLVDGEPVVRKVVSSQTEGTTCVVLTESVTSEEAFKSIDIQGSSVVDLTETILSSPELDIQYIVGGTAEENWEDGTTYDSVEAVNGQAVDAVVITQSYDIPALVKTKYDIADGVTADISCTISLCTVDKGTSVKKLIGYNQKAFVKADVMFNFSCNVSMDVLKAIGVAPSIQLAKIPLAYGIGYLTVTLEMSLQGNILINYVEMVSVGVQYSSKEGFSITKISTSNPSL